MNSAFLIVLLAIYILNVLLHTFGMYFLVLLYRNGVDTAQQILLINLSLIEAVVNFLRIFTIPFYRLATIPDNVVVSMMNINHVAMFITNTGAFLIYYFSITYITIDRFLEIKLNIKYMLYVDCRRTKYLLGVTWIVGIVVSLCFSLIDKVTAFKIIEKYLHPFYTALDIVFLILALVTYGFIFSKFVLTRSTPCRSRPVTSQSVIRILYRSRFFISALLMASFLVLSILPDFVAFFINSLVERRGQIILAMTTDVLYAISSTVDAIVYIFVNVKLRKLVLKKLRIIQRLWCQADLSERYQRKPWFIPSKRDTSIVTVTSKL